MGTKFTLVLATILSTCLNASTLLHERTNLPVWRVCVSSWGRRPEEGTRRGKSCSTVHRPDKAIPDMLLVGGIEDERGGRVSRQEATISRGCGEEEERDNERQNTSSVFAWLVFSNWLVRKVEARENASSTGISKVRVSMAGTPPTE